jgi:hypothetical protein
MVKGYIKRLHAINVAPQQIAFTYRNDKRLHSLEEVMALREEAWFRKGIALAPECNRHIVQASIRRCLMMRELLAFITKLSLPLVQSTTPSKSALYMNRTAF